VWQVGDIDLSRLIQEAKAEVILIDEIDKLLCNMNMHGQGQLLSRIEKIRKCRPGLITIFTANSVKHFPEAMLRPGRIDDIIEFTYPGQDDRQSILKGYSDVMGVDVGDDVVSQIAGMSEGLTGAWLKEVVLQMKVSDPTTACSLIEKMLKYAKSKNDD
jgi:ATP-dependent 26S proteasome regulatory subunit